MSGLSEQNQYIVPNKLGKLIDNKGNDVGFQISNSGGTINLSSGFTYSSGFYIAIAGDEGILNIKLKDSNNPIVLPFFKGWNPVLLSEVITNSGNTATQVYWGI